MVVVLKVLIDERTMRERSGKLDIVRNTCYQCMHTPLVYKPLISREKSTISTIQLDCCIQGGLRRLGKSEFAEYVTLVKSHSTNDTR